MDHRADNKKCPMRDDKGETAWHVVSECTMLSQREYKRKHDNVPRMIQTPEDDIECDKYKMIRVTQKYCTKKQTL